MYFLKREIAANPTFVEENLADICASIQQGIITILMKKIRKAAKQYQIKEIAMAGGVSANSGLRQALTDLGAQEGWNTYIPAFQYCTDNAGMIGVTAYFKYLKGEFVGQEVGPYARS